MGSPTELSWSRSFVTLFDAVFAARHLSLRCLVRSAVASLVAVAVIWLLMGNLGTLGLRARTDFSLGSVLVTALVVNVAADYISLLETRLVLGQIHRVRSVLGQFGVLVLDVLVSAGIIWVAIFAYLNSPLHQGEVESFAEILGLFSILSVIFYSTFLTSVWSWAHILSTWVLRLVKRLRLADFLDVEKKPIRILALALSFVVSVGAPALALPIRKDTGGLTVADRAPCSLFKGPVCLDVAELTEAEKAKLELIMLACEGGVTEECFSRGLDAWEVKPTEAVRFLRMACEGGHAGGCSALGFHHMTGVGVDPDPAEAARLYRQGCDMGDQDACSLAEDLTAN